MYEIRKNIGLLMYFVSQYPGRSGIMLLSMLLSGVAEGLGFAALLPLIATSIDDKAVPTSQLGVAFRDAFLGIGIEPTIGILLSFIVLVITVKAGLMMLAMSQVGYTMAHVTADLRLKFMRGLIAAEWDYFVNNRTGVSTNVIVAEISRAARCYLGACRLVAGMIQVAVYMILALLISWYVTLGAAVVGALSLALLGGFIKVSRQAGGKLTELQKALMTRLIEALHSMKSIKAMALEERVMPLLESDISGLKSVQEKLVVSKEGVMQLQEPIRVLAVAIALYFLLGLWKNHPASILVMVLLFMRTVTRVNALQASYHDISSTESAFAFVREAMKRVTESREVSDCGHKVAAWKSISLRNVTFAYKGHEVFQNLSIEIPAGCFVAIIGPSGVGKTTIVDMVIGLYRPQKGSVFVGEVALADLDLHDWRMRIGYVPQETILFHETIHVNVTLGDKSFQVNDVEDALVAAEAQEFVKLLPKGVDTIVGERGAKLSGGQRQRIAIARALIRRPELLILDEATAGLDLPTEVAIYRTLRRLTPGLTVLAISHQSALIEAADLVYRLDSSGVQIVKELRPGITAGGRRQ